MRGLAPGELTWRGPIEPEDSSAERKQSVVQMLAEAFGQLDNLFVTQQPHNIPQTVIHSRAVVTALKVFLDL